MRLQHKLGVQVFAVLIDKTNMPKGTDPRLKAWEFLLQRLERFATKNNEPILIVHDEGDSASIRTWSRKARRAGAAGSRFGTGVLRLPFRLLLDDPVPRSSAHSYFIQLADLDAYAAFRRIFPPPKRIVPIVPKRTWQELRKARLIPVNQLRGGVIGIVKWP